MINNYDVSNETKTILCLSPKSSNNKNYEISVSKLVEFNLNKLYVFKIENPLFKLCIISRYDKAYSNIGNLYNISLDSYIKEFKTQHNKIKDFKYRILTTIIILFEIPVYEFIEKMRENGIYIEGGYQNKRYTLTSTEIRLGYILNLFKIDVAYNINDPDLLLNNRSEFYKKMMVYKYNKFSLGFNIRYPSIYDKAR